MPARVLAVVVLAACLVACSKRDAPDAGPDVDAGHPEAEIGTGNQAFEPLTDGQDVDLHAGCQGGYHVWGAVRARGLDPRSPVLDFTATRVRDGMDVLYMPIHVRSTLSLEGSTDWYDGYAYTVRMTNMADVVGEDLDIGVMVTDRNGAHASDVRRVHVIEGASACTTDAAVFDTPDASVTDGGTPDASEAD